MMIYISKIEYENEDIHLINPSTSDSSSLSVLINELCKSNSSKKVLSDLKYRYFDFNDLYGKDVYEKQSTKITMSEQSYNNLISNTKLKYSKKGIKKIFLQI